MNIFIEAWNRKREARDKLLHDFDVNTRKSVRDWHAKRRPIACGLTVHTGVGCPLQCRYCYIYSMGFPRKIDKYPLEPQEVVYAILSNPWFVPGRYGTFLALGSVTEPFHPKTESYTLELIRLIRKYLGNPTQLSTKMSVDIETVESIKRSHPNISILYSVTTLSYSSIVEPYVPSPLNRFKSMNRFVKLGIHTTLFVRPVLPGVTDVEIRRILELALENGVDRVVYGTLRVNKDILDSLLSMGIEKLNHELSIRLPRKDLTRRQEYIKAGDVKTRIVREAIDMGLKVFPSACSANIDADGSSCSICRFGPCGEPKNLPKIFEEELNEFIEYVGMKGKITIYSVENHELIVKRNSRGKDVEYILEFIKTVSRRRMKIL